MSHEINAEAFQPRKSQNISDLECGSVHHCGGRLLLQIPQPLLLRRRQRHHRCALYLKITGTLEKLKATIAEVELVDIPSFIGFTKEGVTSMDCL